MVSRYPPASRNHRASVYVGPDDNVAEDRELNDSRLRRAITYLADEGGDDDPALYIQRVQQIDDGIINQYRDEDYMFDANLYRRLRSMVREVQHDFQAAAQEESSVDFEESDVSMEDLPPQALYRSHSYSELDFADHAQSDPPGSNEDLPVETVMNDGPRRAIGNDNAIEIPSNSEDEEVEWHTPESSESEGHLPEPPPEEIREKRYLYGGPNNTAEKRQVGLAILPFGENFFMQDWESKKIDYDLIESAKKRAGDQNQPIMTNVPYNWVSTALNPRETDSGSRYKLPANAGLRERLRAKQTGSLAEEITKFNQGHIPQEKGKARTLAKRSYVPRIFLKQVINERVAPSANKGASPSTSGSSRSRSAAGSSNTGKTQSTAGKQNKSTDISSRPKTPESSESRTVNHNSPKVGTPTKGSTSKSSGVGNLFGGIIPQQTSKDAPQKARPTTSTSKKAPNEAKSPKTSGNAPSKASKQTGSAVLAKRNAPDSGPIRTWSMRKNPKKNEPTKEDTPSTQRSSSTKPTTTPKKAKDLPPMEPYDTTALFEKYSKDKANRSLKAAPKQKAANAQSVSASKTQVATRGSPASVRAATPLKHPIVKIPAAPRRGPGRPRKNPLPTNPSPVKARASSVAAAAGLPVKQKRTVVADPAYLESASEDDSESYSEEEEDDDPYREYGRSVSATRGKGKAATPATSSKRKVGFAAQEAPPTKRRKGPVSTPKSALKKKGSAAMPKGPLKSAYQLRSRQVGE
ncbi:hypothetical protein CC80DRAFT_14322 [Byssothecium circinans]|uniref:Uncharacterized protein n=1 Tax=Byssothecium circinans TaxID=147558 RepID=A0A6A5U1K7_9PLEO|nr:hypothetical protein CC80DRAFT_14322 [Byssothecium circinans]